MGRWFLLERETSKCPAQERHPLHPHPPQAEWTAGRRDQKSKLQALPSEGPAQGVPHLLVGCFTCFPGPRSSFPTSLRAGRCKKQLYCVTSS